MRQMHMVLKQVIFSEFQRLTDAEPHHWVATGATNLQQGLMALTRAVAQPTTF